MIIRMLIMRKMIIIRKENVSNLCCKPPWQSFHTNLQRPACQIPQLANPLLLNEVGEPDQRPAHSTLQLPRSVVEPFQQIVLAVLAIWKFSFNWNISALCEYIDVFQSRRNACSHQNVQKPIPTFNHPVATNSGVLDIMGTFWQTFCRILWEYCDKHWILWEYCVFHRKTFQYGPISVDPQPGTTSQIADIKQPGQY